MPHPQNFAEKTFADSSKTAKSAKVFRYTVVGDEVRLDKACRCLQLVVSVSVVPRPIRKIGEKGLVLRSRSRFINKALYKEHDSTCTTHAGKVTYKHDT